jgi:hypothetical protein
VDLAAKDWRTNRGNLLRFFYDVPVRRQIAFDRMRPEWAVAMSVIFLRNRQQNAPVPRWGRTAANAVRVQRIPRVLRQDQHQERPCMNTRASSPGQDCHPFADLGAWQREERQ